MWEIIFAGLESEHCMGCSYDYYPRLYDSLVKIQVLYILILIICVIPKKFQK
jgi:hypothetical protein